MDRKKYVLNSLIFCILTFAVFIIVLITSYYSVKNNFETSVKNISDAVVFKLQNISETPQSVIGDYKIYDDIQLSFFEKDKTEPKYDTSSSPVPEDSFNIISKNNDKIYYKFSNTYNYKMGYYVTFVDDYDLYLRVGKKEDPAIDVLSNAMIYGTIALVFVDVMYIVLKWLKNLSCRLENCVI